jgi:hypothetical protein
MWNLKMLVSQVQDELSVAGESKGMAEWGKADQWIPFHS